MEENHNNFKHVGHLYSMNYSEITKTKYTKCFITLLPFQIEF